MMDETAPAQDPSKASAKPATRAAPAAEAQAVDWAHVVAQIPTPKTAERGWIAPLWFACCVVLPLAVTWLYIAQIATAQYTASFRYVMQGSASATGAAGASGASVVRPPSCSLRTSWWPTI